MGSLLAPPSLKAAPHGAVLDEAELAGQLLVLGDLLLHVGVQLRAGHGEGEQLALVAQLGEVFGSQQLVEGGLPELVVLIAHLRPDVETAHHRPDDVEALLLGGGDIGHAFILQALLGEHREDAHLAGADVRHGVGDVRAAHLDMPAQQRRGDLAAALQGDVTQLLRIDAGGLCDQRGLHPVLAADGAAGADHYLARVGLERSDQVAEVLVRRVAGHRDGAVAGAHGGQPFHGVFVEAAELALGQVQQRAAGEGGDGVAVGRTLGDHRVVGHGADTAGHVGDAHRLGQQLLVHQGALRQLAGEIEAAAGRGRGDAFRALGLGHQLAGGEQGGAGQGQVAQDGGHGAMPLLLLSVYQIARE